MRVRLDEQFWALVAIMAFLWALGGCSLERLFGEETAVPFDPPFEYLWWYSNLAACHERSVPPDFRLIEWYSFEPGALTIRGRDEPPWGVWLAPRSVYIQNDRLDDERLVKHEMTHYLFGDKGHTQFNGCEWQTTPTG
jgi:hypothetical protein